MSAIGKGIKAVKKGTKKLRKSDESPVRTQINEVPDNTKASDKELEKMLWQGEGEEPDVMDIGRPEPEVKESKLQKDLNKKPDEAEVQGPKVKEDAKDKAAIKEVSKLQEKLNPETSMDSDGFPKGNWRDNLKKTVGGLALAGGGYSLFDKDKESKYNLGLDQPGSLDKPGGQISTLSKDDKKGGGTGDGNNNIVTPQIPEPESLDSLMKKINGMTVGMSADQKELFKKQFDDLEELKNKVTGEYKKEKDNLAMAELVTDVANSLTQLFAGAYGLKHGVDMSGLKFKQTDWSAKLDSAKEDLNKRLADISKGEESLSKQQSDILERQEKDKDFKAKLMIKEWMQQKRDYNKSLMQLDKLNKQAAMAKQKKDPNAKGYERAALEAEKNLISPLQRDVALIEDVRQKLVGLGDSEVTEEQVYAAMLKLPMPVLKELKKDLGEPKFWANLFRGQGEPVEKEILTSGVLKKLEPYLAVKSDAKQNLINAAQSNRQTVMKSLGQSAIDSESNISNQTINTVRRRTKDGRVAIFNADTERFLKYE